MAAPYEDDILQEAQTDGKYFCTKDKAQVLQKKRKRGQDPWTKGREEEFLGASTQGYNFCCFLRGSCEKCPRAAAAFPAAERRLLPHQAAKRCLPRVTEWSLSFPCNKTLCTVLWQGFYLQPEQPLLMVSQSSLSTVATSALPTPKLTELRPSCLLSRSERWWLEKAKFPGVSY